MQLSKECGFFVDDLLSVFTETLTKLSTNPYLSSIRILKCLQFVDLQMNKKLSDSIQDIILKHVESILDFTKQKLFAPIEENDYRLEILTCCFGIVSALFTFPSACKSLEKFIENIGTPLLQSLQGLHGKEKDHHA